MSKVFKQLLKQVKLTKKESDTKIVRNHLKESCQEYDYLNMKMFSERLIESMQEIAKKNDQNIEIKCFNKILESVSKHSTCLLSNGKNIAELLESVNYVALNHEHYNSQAILLAIYLKYFFVNSKVKVLTSEQNMKHWQKYLVSDKCNDASTVLASLIKESEVKVEFFENSYEVPLNKDEILILDVFNVDYTEYKPYLFSKRTELGTSNKVILYHSHIQRPQIEDILDQISVMDFVPTQIDLQYPVQIEFTAKDNDIKQNLISFLKQDGNHPEKQDIIIFYRNQHLANSTSKRFSSKLKQLLSQNKLQHHIQLITQPNEPLIAGKNYIFITENTQELSKWNYNYDNVFYVIDYGWNVFYRKDHTNISFVEGFEKEDIREKSRRMAYVGLNKVGKYVYKESDIQQATPLVEEAKQLSIYCIRMIRFSLIQFLEMNNFRVKSCIESLKQCNIVKCEKQGMLQLAQEQKVLEILSKKVDPIQTYIIQNFFKDKDKNSSDVKTMGNLLIMALVVMSHKGNLRLNKDTMDTKSVTKPSGVWRRTGYLHSCLQIITKVELIENRKRKNSRSQNFSKRNTSKANQNQIDAFGSLFEINVPKRMEFQDMDMEDLIRQYHVNDLVLNQLRDDIDYLRQYYGIEQTSINLDTELMSKVSENFAKLCPTTIAYFSGSRRNGFILEKSCAIAQKGKQVSTSLFPHKDSLIAQLNETPQFLIILRYFQFEQKRQILMCNHFSLDNYMSVVGSLPQKRQDSLAQFQLEFHGISSGVFKGLFKNNSSEIKRFQNENTCFIEPNEQMATLTIYCSKQHSQKIKTGFEELLVKIKDKYVNYNKIIHYLGNTNIVMSNGGQIKEVIKDKYVNSCYLNNLDLEVTVQDLEELFDEFFVLKNIQVLEPELNKYSKTAIIDFNSQKDYYRFHSYYNECKYLDRLMEVNPILQKNINVANEQKYIEFKWYVWKSHKKGLVQFVQKQHANEAYQKFIDKPELGNKKVKIQLKDNKLIIDDLDITFDEIALQKTFTPFGEIKQVQILKTPLKEPASQEYKLECLIKDTLQIQQNQNKYVMHEVQRCKNGLRKCKVEISDIQNLNKLIQLNELKNKMGEGNLYAESWYIKPILIAYPSCVQIYQQLFQEVLAQTKKNQDNGQSVNVQTNLNTVGNKLYLCLKSSIKETIDYLSNAFQLKLKPYPIQLTEAQRNIIISDIGLQNLLDLEEKFNCKLIVHSMKKTLQVICKHENIKRIRDEVTARVEENFFYRISLNNKSFKNLSKNQEKLKEIKKTYFLSLLQIEEFSKTMIFEGSALQVQNALNYMMHLIESFSVPEEELVNTDVCLICYQEPFRPYRLQNCGHKFCFACLDQCINSTLGDASTFPIKCPHCMVELTIDDLESLIDKSSWPKLINMAINKFVGQNSDNFTFCFTAGCKQVNALELNYFKCDTCETSYCCECKMKRHAGMTCQQAKMGGDRLFKEYMQKNGVRQCPYKSCKMPIIRTDGCYRVTCSRCNKSMCFKCEPKNMIAYDDYNQCYKHLQDVHGGYW